MADKTKIEWTDATWNPITGCEIVSAGCTNCYAMKLAGTRLKDHPSRAGLTKPSKAGPVWNGEVRFNEQWLDQPLRWQKPMMIFVCAHGDLFYEAVPTEWIDRVFGIMALATDHTFQVLTKRPERMRAYLADPLAQGRIAKAAMDAAPVGRNIGDAALMVVPTSEHPYQFGEDRWPLPNVWLGVSTEDQKAANKRIPPLLLTPAAIHFASYEPAIGAVDYTRICVAVEHGRGRYFDALDHDEADEYEGPPENYAALNWVIAGGESQPGSRPADPEWFRQVRRACNEAGVSFLFKQWGDWLPLGEATSLLNPEGRPGLQWDIQHVGGYLPMARVGKKAAGRLLDGRTHDEFPGRAA